MKLDFLHINEISGVDEPANAIPGFTVMKSRKASLPGVTVTEFDGGFIAIADSWVEKLRARGGDEAVSAHLDEALGTLGGGATTVQKLKDPPERTVNGLVTWTPGRRYSRIW